jgi:hypothetical protein
MTTSFNYSKNLSSKKTEALFIGLTVLFAVLFAVFASRRLFSGWSILFFCLSVFFLFYSLNYRTLIIQIDGRNLRLRFGIFHWTIPLSNIEACVPDTVSLARIGGAGIHFTPINGRYRAIFNFLEYPRVVVRLKVRKGLVRDIAFSTRHPDEIIHLIGDSSPEMVHN